MLKLEQEEFDDLIDNLCNLLVDLWNEETDLDDLANTLGITRDKLDQAFNTLGGVD